MRTLRLATSSAGNTNTRAVLEAKIRAKRQEKKRLGSSTGQWPFILVSTQLQTGPPYIFKSIFVKSAVHSDHWVPFELVISNWKVLPCVFSCARAVCMYVAGCCIASTLDFPCFYFHPIPSVRGLSALLAVSVPNQFASAVV
jgi:hypothetical protein